MARPLGALLGARVKKTRRVSPQTVVIPIPLHARRLRTRGFNQAALLAHHCAETLRRPMLEGALVRRKPTVVQAKLARNERFSNMRRAFWVPQPQQVRGRFVLLVDDIFTTGATCVAATIALLRAGATGVGVACVAVAVAERDMTPQAVQAKRRL